MSVYDTKQLKAYDLNNERKRNIKKIKDILNNGIDEENLEKILKSFPGNREIDKVIENYKKKKEIIQSTEKNYQLTKRPKSQGKIFIKSINKKMNIKFNPKPKEKNADLKIPNVLATNNESSEKKNSENNKINTNNNNNALMVGFIGYPNVGKSSIINVLMKTKKAAVANIPGRTKHYQTLFLPSEPNLNILPKSICLVDCPGLIFPSFTSSKADMLVNGIYPIDTISEIYNPIQIIINLIPSKILSNFYKVNLPDIYSAKQFLQIIAKKRGFYTGNGLPEEAKTAKLVLRDYTSGKLLFCHLRPDFSEEKYGKIPQYENNIELTKEEKENHKLIENIPANFDDNYEKLYAENESILENKKIIGENVDINFFVGQNIKNEKNKEMENKPLTK